MLPDKAPLLRQAESTPTFESGVVDSASTPGAETLSEKLLHAMSGHEYLRHVTVIATPGELPGDAQAYLLEKGLNPTLVKGVFTHGGSYVIAGNVTSVEDGIRTALHEVVGHEGIRALLGERFAPVMRELYDTFPRQHDAWFTTANRYGYLDTGTDAGKIAFSEELVAHLAESNTELGELDMIRAEIRAQLREQLPDLPMTDIEVKALIQRSRESLIIRHGSPEAVEEVQKRLARRSKVAGMLMESMARNGKGVPDALSLALHREGSQVLDQDGLPCRLYHGAGRDLAQVEGTFWGAVDPAFANEYAEMRADQGTNASIVPYYANIQRPFNGDALKGIRTTIETPDGLTAKLFAQELVSQAKLEGPEADALIAKGVQLYRLGRIEESGPSYFPHDFWYGTRSMFGIEGEQLIQEMFHLAGFDGIRYTEQEHVTYGAFTPAQLHFLDQGASPRGWQPDRHHGEGPVTERVEFKKWFGGSRVVTPTGDAKRMFHATTGDIVSFDGRFIRPTDLDADCNGFWFSSRSNTQPATQEPTTIMPVYLAIESPAPYDVVQTVASEVRSDGKLRPKARSVHDEVRYRLQEQGYDGFFFKEPLQLTDEQRNAFARTGVLEAEGPDGAYTLRSRQEPELAPAVVEHETRLICASTPMGEVRLNAQAGAVHILTELVTREAVRPADLKANTLSTLQKLCDGTLTEGEVGGLRLILDVEVDRVTELAPTGKQISMVDYFTPGVGHVTSYESLEAFEHAQDELVAVAFRPEQIKSAIGNRGTFLSNHPDVRFSLRRDPYSMTVGQAADEAALLAQRVQAAYEQGFDAEAERLDARLEALYQRIEDGQLRAEEDGLHAPTSINENPPQSATAPGDPLDDEDSFEVHAEDSFDLDLGNRYHALFYGREKDAVTESEKIDLLRSCVEDYAHFHGGLRDGLRDEEILAAAAEAYRVVQRRSEHGIEAIAFKHWFGNSKVIDGLGLPLSVYHGTPELDFDRFEKQGINEGFCFTPTVALAEGFAGPNGRVIEAKLSLQNPIDMRSDPEAWEAFHGQGLMKQLIEQGYDGAIFHEPVGDFADGSELVYLAFQADQINVVKSTPAGTLVAENSEGPAGNSAYRFRVSQPNGKVLTPFERWFKDSKVVDSDGKPLQVYHGSQQAGFTVFDTDGEGKTAGTGAWFTQSERGAHTYAGTMDGAPIINREEFFERPDLYDVEVEHDGDEFIASFSDGEVEGIGGTAREALGELLEELEEVWRQPGIYPVYLSLQDPLVVDCHDASWNEIVTYWEVTRDDEVVDTFYSPAEAEAYVEENPDCEVSPGHPYTTDELARQARDMGCDGVIFHNIMDEGPFGDGYGWDNTMYVAFSPTQIKSVENVGSYDPLNPDIRFSLADAPAIPQPESESVDGEGLTRVAEHQALDFDKLSVQISADSYNHTEIRPETKAVQKELGRSALADLHRHLTSRFKRKLGTVRDPGEGISLVGAAISRDFIAGRPAQLLNRPIRNSEDLAALAQVYRDPRFETLRFMLMRGNKVIGETAVTSRMPSSVSMGPAAKDKLEQLMRDAGADGYYVLHNHPSGISSPSDADIRFTQTLAAAVPGFRSHVIIDHNEYSTIDHNGAVDTVFVKEFEVKQFSLEPTQPHPVLGRTIRNEREAAEAIKLLNTKAGDAVIIGTSASTGSTRIVTSLPLDYIDYVHANASDPAVRNEALAALRQLLRAGGAGGYTFLVMPEVSEERLLQYEWLKESGLFRDVFSHEGESLGFKMELARSYMLQANPIEATARGMWRTDLAAGTSEPGGSGEPSKDAQPQVPDVGDSGFADWFEGSRVVDATGLPIPVYHGGPTKGIKHFKGRMEPVPLPGETINWTGEQEVIYFNSDKAAAKTYGTHLYEAYLKLRNPLVIDAKGQEWGDILPSRHVPQAVTNGHDGIIVTNIIDVADVGGMAEPATVYMAFDPEQIRLSSEVGKQHQRRRGASGQVELSSTIPGTPAEEVLDVVAESTGAHPEEAVAPSLEEWFGESRVVDGEGKPQVVYHGTVESFSEFDADWIGTGNGLADFGEGFYFSNLSDASSEYAEGPGGNIMPVYLNIKNPADLDVVLRDDIQAALDDDMGFTNIAETLEKLGYDGIAVDREGGTEYVVFHPEQIRSVFDPANYPSIQRARKLEQDRAARFDKSDASTGDKSQDAGAGQRSGSRAQGFQEWFGQSLVVDEKGAPLMVYRGEHGEPASMSSLQYRLPSISFGDQETANIYATSSEVGQARVYPVYLRIEKPVMYSEDPFLELSDAIAAIGEDRARQLVLEMAAWVEGSNLWEGEYASRYASVEELLKAEPEELANLYIQAYPVFDNPGYVEWFREAGYDGVVHGGSGYGSAGRYEFKVFSPSQVRSALDGANFVSEPSCSPEAKVVAWAQPEGLIETDAYAGAARRTQSAEMSGQSLSSQLPTAFERWIGQSRVVAEDGAPLVVYKGMYPYDIETETQDNPLGQEIAEIHRKVPFPAFYNGEPGIQIAGFFGDRDTANRFAMAMGDRGAVYPVYLSLQNPYEIDAQGAFAGDIQFGASGQAFRDAMRSGKYDGAIIRNTRDEGTIYVASRPDQIKSVFNVGTFDPAAKDIRLCFAGESASTAPKMTLAYAKQAHAAGMAMELIREHTGWEQGVDGQWRFEIDDSAARLNAGESTSTNPDHFIDWVEEAASRERGVPLAQVMSHEDLFKAYPQLMAYRVQVVEAGSVPGSGALDHENRVVKIIDPYGMPAREDGVNPALSVLLHEIQHAIQHIEGFAYGGQPAHMQQVLEDAAIAKLEERHERVYASDLVPDEVTRVERREVREDEPVVAVDRAAALRESRSPKELSQMQGEAVFEKAGQEYGDTAYTKQELFDGYQRLAGEVEARNVQRRISMAMDERKQVPPEITEDVPREHQLMVDRDGKLFNASTEDKGLALSYIDKMNGCVVNTTRHGVQLQEIASVMVEFLEDAGLRYGWMDGGCRIFAEALRDWSDGKILLGVTSADGKTASHVVGVLALSDDPESPCVLIDADGLASPTVMLEKLDWLESSPGEKVIGIGDLADQLAQSLPIDEAVVDQAVQSLEVGLGTFSQWAKGLQSELTADLAIGFPEQIQDAERAVVAGFVAPGGP